MDELAKAKFDEIVAKPIDELNDNEILILQARRSYLNAKQKGAYSKVLAIKVDQSKEKAVETPIKDLRAESAKHGYPVKGRTKDQLDETIRTADGPLYVAKKDQEAFAKEDNK